MKRTFVLLCAMLSFLFTSRAQNAVQIQTLLTDEGIEDIRMYIAGDTVYLSFEDHAYRGTFRGAATALQKIAQAYPEIAHFELLLTDYQQPQIAIHATRQAGIWNVIADRQMSKCLNRLHNIKAEARSTGKIDITVFPKVSLINNKLDHLFDYSVSIAPAIAATLWKGGRLTLQPIFPIINNLEEQETNRYIQIGTANLSQQFISTRRWQLSAAAGFFYPERVGVYAKLGFHACKGLDLYIDGGYTYLANYSKQKGFGLVRNSAKVNFMAKADYYEHHSKLQFELQGGRFLYGDYGGRFDVTRHFGEYAIGVYGILTGGEHNLGFHFAIPMGGKRQKRNGFIRLRLPEYVGWEYSMQSYFKYWLEKMGERYTTQPDETRADHYWEPQFIQEYVSRILNGTFK